jgi:hypothetical protein
MGLQRKAKARISKIKYSVGCNDMDDYKQLINSCRGSFNENDVHIGYELAKSLIEQGCEKVTIDIV